MIWNVVLAAVMSVAALWGYARFIEPNWVTVTRLTIRDRALASALGSRRLVQISDLHLERLDARARRVITLVNRQRADWIVVTGDLINDATGWPPARDVVSRLRARDGIWAVPGNTDNYYLTAQQYDGDMRAAGARVLRNAAAPLDHTGAWLVGVDDPVNKLDQLERALRDVPAGAPVILLAHSPDIMPDAVAAEIPLVLVGHTHGGQIGIPWLIHRSSYANRGRYILGGLYHDGATQLYLNRGIGHKVLPYRFLAPPEITVIDFVNDQWQETGDR